MRSLNELAGQELLWTPSKSVKRSYMLQAGEETIGMLSWQSGSLAVAEMGSDHWTLKRDGFWHPRVTMWVAGSAADIAIFRPSWSGAGTLELPPARRIQWSSAGMWRAQWTWQELDGRPLVHFKSRQGWSKHEGIVTAEPAATGSLELPMLVVLGWYLLVLLAQDTTAATVVTVS